MNSPWWQHGLVFCVAVILVLVWIVRNIDYDNLVKWRGIVRERSWSQLALLGLTVIVLATAYLVYRIIIRLPT